MRTSAKSAAVLICLASTVFALTGEEILDRMDQNRDHKTVVADATMRIHIGDEVRTKTMIIRSITEGSKSIVEFTNPADEGTKYLMLDDDLWIYFPEEEDVVKISGHLLKQGMMGSDVSYEDALESDQLSEKYAITLEKEEAYEGKPCHVIFLEATTKDAPYYQRRMWVEKGTFVAWKEEMYAKSGKLLKEAVVLEIREIGGRYFPVKSAMINKLRKNSRTVFEMSNIKLDVELDEGQFSLRWLRR
ncbi:MAG: outer membrane lipoprotein-sorting protein [Chitinivibrionales bacterium]|nr:outer membrane lipoprotein-sorting protein [Chitinivibrionales bacterium]MBD3394270.1 outer membrane lipoprotein-sorting protein [Chitinivibrionales bacterium]